MITKLEEFTEIIEGQYHIKDIPTYMEFKKDRGKNGVSQSEIELMSPDSVNSASFWQWIENNPQLAKDSIAFNATPEMSIEQVNKNNLGLACQLGMLNTLIMYRDCEGMPILDIGAGYGMLKEFVEKNTKLKYVGVDVYPKIPGILPLIDNDSTLPPNVKASQFGAVIATNVFQHLSIKQRRHYYEQVFEILHPFVGIFSVSLTCNNPESNNCAGFKCNETGKRYMCHYGQYTEIQDFNDIIQDLKKHFNIITITQRPWDNSVAFHCTVKFPSGVTITAR